MRKDILTYATARDAARSVYREQRRLGSSHTAAQTLAARHYAELTGHTLAGAQCVVAALLRADRERAIPGYSL